MYLDLFFDIENDELDEFLEDVEEELEEARNDDEDDVIVVDGVIEVDINKYKNFYEEIPSNGDFEAKKDEVIELIKNEIKEVLNDY